MAKKNRNNIENLNRMKTELQIGNWVQTKCKMSYYTTMQESSFSVPFDKNYKRIKLTENWLERLQFEWRPCSWVGSLYRSETIKGLTVFIDRNGLFRAEYLDNENWVVNKYVKYVDELQNIVNYWTGLELEHKK